MKINDTDLKDILAQALETIKQKSGKSFNIESVNLAEMQRLTGISRAKLRRLKRNGFEVLPNGNKGKQSNKKVISGYETVINHLLESNVTNSEVILKHIQELGYIGSHTSVKRYISSHKHLIPAVREIVSSQGNRGRRYQTDAGEVYQMDWGFVKVLTQDSTEYQCACFAMICHHCGERYIEFFPNAKQENLFIGMIHAFQYMGVPQTVLTDNMKSVVISRDATGNPIWQKDYEVFMNTVGFKTKLCKARHPFTKGKVERLVRLVKENFITGRTFGNITDLNYEAVKWCNEQNSNYHKSLDCVPSEKHCKECMAVSRKLEMIKEIYSYLCPIRKISFDGFVNYEGRRFGVPYWYTEKTCRVCRKDFYLHIYDTKLTRELTSHNITWSRRDSYAHDQYVTSQPEESPTAPVKAVLSEIETPKSEVGFSKFDFRKKVQWDD